MAARLGSVPWLGLRRSTETFSGLRVIARLLSGTYTGGTMTQQAPEQSLQADDRDAQSAPAWDIVMRLFDEALASSATPRSAIALTTLTLDLLKDSRQRVD